MCSSIIGSSHTVYKNIQKQTTNPNSCVGFSKLYVGSSDWSSWKHPRINPIGLTKSKGTKGRLSDTYVITSANTKITRIYSSTFWRTRKIPRIVAPQVCPHSGWYYQNSSMKWQQSFFLVVISSDLSVYVSTRIFDNRLWGDGNSWEQSLKTINCCAEAR